MEPEDLALIYITLLGILKSLPALSKEHETAARMTIEAIEIRVKEIQESLV